MSRTVRPNIFLTGFSGAGKSSAGRAVAIRLNWTPVDMDTRIAESEGKPVADIFRDRGEEYFRGLERGLLAELCQKEQQVISTGGGIVADERNRRAMANAGVVVCLEAAPEVLYERLQSQHRQNRRDEVRPLLIAENPLERIRQLKAERQHWYATADRVIQTDALELGDVADEVVRCWRGISEGRESLKDPELASLVRASTGDYPVWVGWGLMEGLGDRARDLVSPAAAYVVTDPGAYGHGRAAQRSLEAAGVPAHIFQIPGGEVSKSLEVVSKIYAWLAELRARRGDLVLAVGGGIVGDVAGFAAATFLRGMPFAQVPTTMLAMMDSSIGGKTGVDLPEGKNLVGAFHQPKFVLADVSTLGTLPDRALNSGWAEAIKHGLILDEPLLTTFEDKADSIMALDRDVATEAIRRSIAIKAGVVSRDEKETLGIRTLLNYGHTIGHAIEAATGYDRFLHGEAVSIGMMAAAGISKDMGLLTGDDVDRQRRVLATYQLPLTCPGVDVDALADAMRMDKKTEGKSIRWVLLNGIGRAITSTDVPEELVRDAVSSVVR